MASQALASKATDVIHPHNDGIPVYRILGAPISITSLDKVIKLFEDDWTVHRRDRYVILRDVHGVMRARSDAKLQRAHEASDLTAPDGMPLVWIAKLAGISGISRVCGPDLLPAVCERGLSLGWRHYFLGGSPGVAETAIQTIEGQISGNIDRRFCLSTISRVN